MGEFGRDVVRALARDTPAYGGTPAPRELRVWALPPVPGPDVRAVRSDDGRRWDVRPRAAGEALWQSGQSSLYSWHELVVMHGPLTEVVDTDGS